MLSLPLPPFLFFFFYSPIRDTSRPSKDRLTKRILRLTLQLRVESVIAAAWIRGTAHSPPEIAAASPLLQVVKGLDIHRTRWWKAEDGWKGKEAAGVPPWGFRLWASRRWATNREGRSTSSTLAGEVIIPFGYDAVKRRSVKTCLLSLLSLSLLAPIFPLPSERFWPFAGLILSPSSVRLSTVS